MTNGVILFLLRVLKKAGLSRILCLVWLGCPLLWAAEPSPDASILVWPPTVAASDSDAFEGVAAFLATRDRLQEPRRVVDLHRLRRHLVGAGLSVTAPLTLASKLKAAQALAVDELYLFTIHQDHLTWQRFDVANRQVIDNGLAQRPDAWEALPPLIADQIGLAHNPTEGYDFYRLWASVYFVDDLTSAQNLMLRLAAHPAAGRQFLEELSVLFGNPTRGDEDVQSIITWRDRFYQHGLFGRAEESSSHLLAQRHNPGDLLDHARILAAQGKREAACDYVRRAASFGFVRSNDEPLLKECQDN